MHVWKAACGLTPEPLLWLLPAGHVWKRLKFHKMYTYQGLCKWPQAHMNIPCSMCEKHHKKGVCVCVCVNKASHIRLASAQLFSVTKSLSSAQPAAAVFYSHKPGLVWNGWMVLPFISCCCETRVGLRLAPTWEIHALSPSAELTSLQRTSWTIQQVWCISATANLLAWLCFLFVFFPFFFYLACYVLLRIFLQILPAFFMSQFLCRRPSWHFRGYQLSYLAITAAIVMRKCFCDTSFHFQPDCFLYIWMWFSISLFVSLIPGSVKEKKYVSDTLPVCKCVILLIKVWSWVNSPYKLKGEVCAVGVASRLYLGQVYQGLNLFFCCPCCSHPKENRGFLPPSLPPPLKVHPAMDDRHSHCSLTRLPHIKLALKLLQGSTVWSCPVWLQTKHQ